MHNVFFYGWLLLACMWYTINIIVILQVSNAYRFIFSRANLTLPGSWFVIFLQFLYPLLWNRWWEYWLLPFEYCMSLFFRARELMHTDLSLHECTSGKWAEQTTGLNTSAPNLQHAFYQCIQNKQQGSENVLNVICHMDRSVSLVKMEVKPCIYSPIFCTKC